MKSLQSKRSRRAAAAFTALYASAVAALGIERMPLNSEVQPYSLDTGVCSNNSTNYLVAFSAPIQATGKPSKLRIHFSSFNLGKRSYVALISARDGGKQQLDRTSMGYWQSTSAIFNGDTVNLQLTVAPGEQGIFAKIDQLVLQCDCPEQVLDVSSVRPLTLCGGDSRVASTDNRVGRISGCTAWLISNGGVLTAGHCGPVSGVFEVNVPASTSNGTQVASAPEDQYPIDTSHRTSMDNGKGDDYTVFDLLPNATTATRAHIRFGFFRMTRENPVAGDTIRVTGFGVDDTPAGPVANCCARDDLGNCTHPNCNAQSRTLQTATGPYVSETVSNASNVFHSYKVDTEPANSGSPIIWNANGFTIGIHTHGGCASDGTGDNDGTSFENDNLEALLQSWPGANTVYVDVVQPPTAPAENGTIFRPFNTVTEAVASVVSGGRISIVEGSYTKAAGNTMTMGADGKSFFLIAPVGTVTIGN